MNSSYAGYTPKKSIDNVELDNLNPYEFRRGMDYELVSLGCSRLRESTLEERMKSTERVVKNLKEHPLYYTSLIHYESEYKNKTKKPTFKKWLKEYSDETKMKPVSEKDVLKEAIKTQIKRKLGLIKEGDELDTGFDDFDSDDVETSKAATKAGNKKGKGVKGLEKEEIDLKEEKEALKDKIFPLIQLFKAKKKGNKTYSKTDYENDLKKIKTKRNSSVASAEFKKDKTKPDHVTDRIKAINARLEIIEKDKEDIILKEKSDKRDVAATIMDRQTHKDLLEIIQECGISMNEGTDNIRPYYEVAKMAYMEGLTAGLRN